MYGPLAELTNRQEGCSCRGSFDAEQDVAPTIRP